MRPEREIFTILTGLLAGTDSPVVDLTGFDMNQIFDVAIIGGGINGCGVAADAALRGLSVILIEKDDIAANTSSSSTKLIHGGLRYLEYYDFFLVKKALNERQLLLNLAPHLVHPLPFVLAYQQSMRPFWILRAGLFLYDYLSFKNRLPGSRVIKRQSQPEYFAPLKKSFEKGFQFYDASTDDARLTIANAVQAHEQGATVCTKTEMLSSSATDNLWHLNLRTAQRSQFSIKARSLVNAAGPWVEQVNQRLQIPSHYNLSLVKGSHLVVKKLYTGNQAYLLQNLDNRVVFVIPYHGYSLIGTTDIGYSGDLNNLRISPDETDYLLRVVGSYFKTKRHATDIISSWSGVRPLLSRSGELPQALSRDYTYQCTQQPAPAVSIYGGKITTYRQLAVEVVDRLKPVFPDLKKSCTARTALPGAVSSTQLPFAEFIHQAEIQYSWLEKSLLKRLLQTYGTRTELVLQNCQQTTDLGENFGNGLYQKEVDYLISHEWAKTSDDILNRRTRLGLSFADSSKLESYLASFGFTGDEPR